VDVCGLSAAGPKRTQHYIGTTGAERHGLSEDEHYSATFWKT
jgi:hypothetical protein